MKTWTSPSSQEVLQHPSGKKTGLIVYDLYVDARGIYLILGVQEGAFKKKKHLFSLAVTSSTKVTCFWQKHEESS